MKKTTLKREAFSASISFVFSLILLDIDGTLIKDDLSISQSTVQALTHAREMGIRIAISTGRYIYGAKFYLDELGIEDGIISSINGALIKDGDRYLRNVPIDKALYERAAKIVSGVASSSIAFSENRYAISADDDFYQMQMRICRSYGERMDISSFDRVREALGEPIYKILVKSRTPKESQRLKMKVIESVGDISEIVSSSALSFEILPKGTNKKNAVEIFQKELGIRREEIIAFGDWDNDADMLSAAGVGVAMGNASPYCKERADFITKDNNHDGISYALKEILKI